MQREYSWQGIVQKSLWGVVRGALLRPWLTVLLAVALAVVAVWYTATELEFLTSRNALVPSQAHYIQNYRIAQEDFGSLDNIIVVVEPPHIARGKQFVDALAMRLRADTQNFASVTAQLDTSSLAGKKLLVLPPADILTLTQRLTDAQDFLTAVTSTPGLQTLLFSMNQEISKALVTHLTTAFLESSTSLPPESPAASQGLDVSFLTALFTELDRVLQQQQSYTFHSPWGSFFLKDNSLFSADGYLTAKNDRFLFVLVEGRSSDRGFLKHALPLKELRAHIQAVRLDFPDVQAGVTGGVPLATDEMIVSQRDTAWATLLALVAVSLLFMLTFRERLRPLLVILTLILAICWTLGLTTLTIGHLNILSVSFTPILIGLGIDFGIHLLARYAEERAYGKEFRSALQITCYQTGPGILAAALTTAAAFFVVLLVDFPGLAELGFITGSGVIVCLLASFTVLPALLAISEGRRQVRPGIWQARSPAPGRFLQRFPRTVLLGLGVLSGVGFLSQTLPTFDYNLLNLQAHGTESVVWEYRLLEGSGRSSWYATSTATSIEELRQKKAAFAALPVVERVDSLVSLLPENQQERLVLLQALPPLLSFHSSWDNLEPVVVDEIDILLDKIRFKLQRSGKEWDPAKRPSEEALGAARAALVSLQERFRALPQSTVETTLASFQKALFADFATKLQLVQDNAQPSAPIGLADVPPYLRERFVGKSGHYLLQIFARDNIWDRGPMTAFVHQLETVDPHVTGSPIVGFYSIQAMQRGYTSSGLYALVVIVGITFALFRRLRPTVLALLPLVVGALWTVLCMALLQIHFNMANLIVLPLFLGIAIDSGIHLVHRALENPEAATSPMARSTGKAVLLSALTTMVGFASLMVAQHTGIFTLGLLATLAIGSNLFASFVLLPLILQLFAPHLAQATYLAATSTTAPSHTPSDS